MLSDWDLISKQWRPCRNTLSIHRDFTFKPIQFQSNHDVWQPYGHARCKKNVRIFGSRLKRDVPFYKRTNQFLCVMWKWLMFFHRAKNVYVVFLHLSLNVLVSDPLSTSKLQDNRVLHLHENQKAPEKDKSTRGQLIIKNILNFKFMKICCTFIPRQLVSISIISFILSTSIRLTLAKNVINTYR